MRIRSMLPLLAAGAIALAACGSDNKSSSSYGATASKAPAATNAPATAAAAASGASATSAAATPATTGNDSAYGGAYGAGSATTAAGAAAGSAAVTLADSSLGKIVVDAKGDTLYAFMKDTSGTSACNDACAKAWPPATVTGTPTEGAGVTGALTTVARSDGSMQLKLGSWPLYRFAGDSGPGQTNGQGTGGLWYVVGADGNVIK